MRSPAASRVLILSDRGVSPQISRCGTYEFEDVAASVDAVDILPLAAPAGRFARRLERWIPAAFSLPPTLPRRAPYDLLYVSVHSLPELARLHPLGRVMGLARRTAINVDELWRSDLLRHSGDLALLRRFDAIFSACAGGAEALEGAIGRAGAYLPPSLDALRFAPPAQPPKRMIDLHLMGRRRPELHKALREAAEKTGRYYHFDTIQFNPRVPDYAEHRARLAELVQRTRYFVVDYANSDLPEKMGQQQEFGPRYVEGAGGGAILIGRAPSTAAFAAAFWPDAVLAIEPDSAAITRLIDELESDPEQLERARNRNVVQVLRRHDSVYRWEQILRAAGLEPLPQLQERKRMLERRAAEIEGRHA